MNSATYNSILHRLALLTAALTFPLIFVGGLVTSHGAGMSVPDWPNTWGYNMFTFPVSKWVGGIRYEHPHRLFASGVGFVAVALVVVAWMTDRRKYIRWTAVGILVAVILQGVIGGVRVLANDRDLAILHGCIAQLFFCFVAIYCVMTSRFRADLPQVSDRESLWIRRVFCLAAIAFICILGQLVIGAIMRHKDAGLAIPDFPLSYGHILPPTVLDNDFRQQAIHEYGPDLGLNRVTLFQIWIHFAHRMGATIVSITILTLSITIFAKLRRIPQIFTPAWILIVLLATQITLGILTVLWRKPADIASAHVAVGSLILVTTCVLGVRLFALSTMGRNIDNNQRVELASAHP